MGICYSNYVINSDNSSLSFLNQKTAHRQCMRWAAALSQKVKKLHFTSCFF